MRQTDIRTPPLSCSTTPSATSRCSTCPALGRERLNFSGRDVPGLRAPALDFAGAATRGEESVVAGYPENGPFRPVAARVRAVEEARGPDIYQNRQVTRQIYSIYAVVRPGNSGGPLLDATLASGQPVVFGVVFAAAVDDAHTGYALTAHEVAADAAEGAQATQEVGTQSCD
jgi:hypothetical protein